MGLNKETKQEVFQHLLFSTELWDKSGSWNNFSDPKRAREYWLEKLTEIGKEAELNVSDSL